MTPIWRGRALLCPLFLAGWLLTTVDARAQAPAEPPADPAIPVQTLDSAAPEPVPAEKSADMIRLDTVQVTAQKKLQVIETVPISMSVVDAKFIANWAITDMRTAMLFVPNVKIEEAGFFSSPRVRGFSFNNNNKAFEPPAGVALDGIPYTRVEYFNSAIFDIKRVEVLRGPQGTTFGKNTTAGLVHIITADPGNKQQGFIDLQGGQLDRKRAEAAFSTPLFDNTVQLRLAGFIEERDGFIQNTTARVSPIAAPELRGVDRHGLRAKLRFPDVFGSQFKLAVESVKLGSLGAGAELFHASERIQEVLRRYDPDTDFVKGNFIASIDEPDGRRVGIDTVSGEWTRGFGDWNVVALAAHSVLKSQLDIDTDFSPAPAIFGHDQDRSPSTTFELRTETPQFGGLFGLCSERCGHSSLLGGVYLQRRDIEGSGFRFRIGTVPFLELTAAAQQDQPFQDLLDTLPPELVGQLFSPIPANPPGGGGANEEVQQGFEQHARATALFGQAEWNFTERWALQLGLRMNWEKKDAAWNSRYTQGMPNPVLRAAGISEFMATREIKEDQLTPKVSLNYKLGDDTHLFLHYARAYKGGGFNAFAFRDMDDELAYGPETAVEWGLDIKSVLMAGRLKANLSFYRQDIDDFQVLTRVPDALTIGLGVTKVENAAKARAQGVEGDLTWLVSRWFTVMGAVGFNDTEYLDFKTNDCPADMDNTDGDDDDRCDATGRPFAFAPRLNGTLLGNLRLPIGGSGLEFTLGGATEYMSKQYLDIDLDERKVQEPFFRYKASVGIGNPKRGWSFRVHGENLTNERTSIRQGDIVPGLFVNLQDPPRTVFGQLRWSF